MPATGHMQAVQGLVLTHVKTHGGPGQLYWECLLEEGTCSTGARLGTLTR